MVMDEPCADILRCRALSTEPHGRCARLISHGPRVWAPQMRPVPAADRMSFERGRATCSETAAERAEHLGMLMFPGPSSVPGGPGRGGAPATSVIVAILYVPAPSSSGESPSHGR